MKLLIIWLLMLTALQLKAQTFKEFFRQKKTQREYLVKQTGLLKIHGDLLKDGYDVTHNGLSSIRNLRNGEFNFHQQYFKSLKSIHPNVAKSPKIDKIYQWYYYMQKQFSKILRGILSDSEWQSINNVVIIIKSESKAGMEELKDLLEPGKLEMSDENRFSRIDKLYDDMLIRFEFTRSFVADIQLLNRQKEKEVRENSFSLKWFDAKD